MQLNKELTAALGNQTLFFVDTDTSHVSIHGDPNNNPIITHFYKDTGQVITKKESVKYIHYQPKR
jgi:hypothetical protein